MRRLLLRLNAKSDAGGLNKKWKRSNLKKTNAAIQNYQVLSPKNECGALGLEYEQRP